MTCTEARAAFSDLYDDALTGAALALLNQHLEECPACRAEWTAFQGATQALTSLGSAVPSPGFAARVRQQVEKPSWGRQVIQWVFVPLRLKVPIQAVALLLLAFAGLLLYQRSPVLRREVEPRQALPPVVSEAPAAKPAPAVPAPAEEAPKGKVGGTPRREIPRAERGEREAASPRASAPPSQSRVETQEDRSPPSLRDEAKKELGRAGTPPESPKGAELSQESRAKAQEPAPAARGLMQSAPAPQALPTPAPASEGQRSSISPGTADALYATAVSEFDRQRYDRAIDSLRAFIAQDPHDARLPDARLRLADAYLAQQRYAEAIPEYEALVREFPQSALIPAAIYRQAQARLALGDRTGCQLLRDVADRYPQSPEAALARETLSSRCR